MKTGSIRKYLLLVILLNAIVTGASAQVKFYARVSDDNIVRGHSFRIEYVIEGYKHIGAFNDPVFRNFDLKQWFDVSSTSRITGTQAAHSQITHSFSRVAIVSPKIAGRLAVPVATAIVNGKLIHSAPLRITVRNSPAAANRQPQDPRQVEDVSEIRAGESMDRKIRENFFLTAEISKKTCYVGEPLMATYKACSRLNANSQVVKRPSFTGFSVLEMVDAYNAEPDVEIIKGKAFYVHLLRKVQLFPLQAGKFKMDEAQVESDVHFVKQNRGTAEDELSELLNPSRNVPLGYSSISKHITLTTTPLTITVKPLPIKDQPAGFSGAVGDFRISVHPVKSESSTGSLVKIGIMIEGTGNFPLITAPAINWPEGTELSNISVNEKTDQYHFPLSGKKTFEYTLSVKNPGELVIPPCHFSYFDPAKEAYVTLQTEPVTITVKAEQRDITGKNTPSAPGIFSLFPRQYLWFGVIALVIFGWLIYQLFFSRSHPASSRKKEPVVAAHSQPAPNDSYTRLTTAFESGDPLLFYRSAQQLLWETAAGKSSPASPLLNKKNIAERLRKENVKEELIRELLDVLNRCEWELYTPEQGKEHMEEIYLRTTAVYNMLSVID